VPPPGSRRCIRENAGGRAPAGQNVCTRDVRAVVVSARHPCTMLAACASDTAGIGVRLSCRCGRSRTGCCCVTRPGQPADLTRWAPRRWKRPAGYVAETPETRGHNSISDRPGRKLTDSTLRQPATRRKHGGRAVPSDLCRGDHASSLTYVIGSEDVRQAERWVGRPPGCHTPAVAGAYAASMSAVSSWPAQTLRDGRVTRYLLLRLRPVQSSSAVLAG